MLRRQLSVLTGLVLLATTGKVFADDVCQILARGIYDTSERINDVDRAQSFRNTFCQKNFTSQQDARGFALNLGIPIDEVPVKLGVNDSQSAFKQSYSEFCDDKAYASSYKDKTKTFVRRVNPFVLQKIQACLTQAGLHFWLEQAADPMALTINARFIPTSTKMHAVLTDDVQLSNLKCKRPLLKHAQIGPAGKSTLCQRMNREPVTVVINADEYIREGNSLQADGIPVPPPPPTLKSCEEYRLEGDHSTFVACNSGTAKGYYWRVLKPRFAPYHEGGVTPTGSDSIKCGKDFIGKTGSTSRYPNYHKFFLDVGTGLATAGAVHREDFNCDYSGDFRSMCGQFTAVCAKQD